MAQVNGIVVWTEGIKAELARRLPKQRKTQRDKLAVLVATMLHVRSANLVELAAGLPRESDRWDMGYQWISRFLANDLVCCDTVMEPFAREILARLAETGEPIPLILDQTKASDRHQILMLSVRWGERALPLAPACPTDQVRGLKAHGACLYGAVGCQGLCSTRRLLFLSFSALAAYPQAGA